MNKRQIIENYINAYNLFEVEKMMLNLDDNFIFKNISNGIENLRTDGIEAFRNQAIEAKTYFSKRKQEIIDYQETDLIVEVGINYQAVLAIDFPNGLKKGDNIELTGKSIFTFKDNKIVEIQDIS